MVVLFIANEQNPIKGASGQNFTDEVKGIL